MVDIPQPASGPAGTKGTVNDPVKMAIFSLCCFFGLYWAWMRIAELNTYLGKEAIKPLFFIIGIFCGPLLIYVYWLMVNAVFEAQQKAGVEAKDEKVIDMICMLCIAPYGVYRLQKKLNDCWQK